MNDSSVIDHNQMQAALRLAARGEGHVEPNPMVGCVIARGEQIVGQGWHERYGGAHAEVNALTAAGEAARGATLYVTLEPCSHHGKTPPCVQAVIQAGVGRVVIARQDPYPNVDGRGIRQLREAGIPVLVGLLADEADQLNAPYLKRVRQGRPWIIAKWAMTLDGKIATRARHSQWISSEASRQVVHRLRGRVDAIMVGSGTAAVDNPRLTARPAGPRLATRIVVDSQARLARDSQLASTAAEVPVIVATGAAAAAERCRALAELGCEVICCAGSTHQQRLDDLLQQLGRREFTNVLVEGGGQLLANLFELGQIDEVHAFVAPRLVGGAEAITAIAGAGVAAVEQGLLLQGVTCQAIGNDVYIHGRTQHDASRTA